MPYGGAILTITLDGDVHDGHQVLGRFPSQLEAIHTLKLAGIEKVIIKCKNEDNYTLDSLRKV